jgi:hypothetical protein
LRKILLGLGGAALLACSVAVASPRYHTLWMYEAGTQLLWSSNEAYIVMHMQRFGWHGSVLGWFWQIFRNFAGGQTETRDSDNSVVVFNYSSAGLQRAEVRGVTTSPFRPLSGNLYTSVNGCRVRWTGSGFEPARAEEVKELQSAALLVGDYDDVGGWSNRMNLLHWGQAGTRHRLAVAGRHVEIRVEAPSGFRDKRLAIVIENEAPREIWSVDSRPQQLTEKQYAAAFHR